MKKSSPNIHPSCNSGSPKNSWSIIHSVDNFCTSVKYPSWRKIFSVADLNEFSPDTTCSFTITLLSSNAIFLK